VISEARVFWWPKNPCTLVILRPLLFQTPVILSPDFSGGIISAVVFCA
jgi:hypothetical protein